MPGNYSKLVTVVTGQTITASERNSEHDNHITNATPDGLDDASESLAAMQATADPYPAGAASQPTSLRGELQRIRYLVAQLSGETNWYEDPDTSLNGTVGALDDAASPASTAASLKVRLDHIVSELKRITGNANWYDAVAVNLLNKLSLAGGTMSGDIAMGTNKLTGLGAGSAAGHSVRFEQLKVIQYTIATETTNFDTTNSAFQNTSLTHSITPSSASNKVLVIACGNLRSSNTATLAQATLARGGTNLGQTDGMAQVNGGTDLDTPCTMIAIDTPASAASVTYNVRLKSNGGNTVSFGRGRTQTIFLAELAP